MLKFDETVNANFEWSEEKNEWLRRTRGISFEEVVHEIRRRNVLAVIDHPNQEKYPGQAVIIVNIDAYAHKIPAVRTETGYFLKTVYPNSKATANISRNRRDITDNANRKEVIYYGHPDFKFFDDEERETIESIENDNAWRPVKNQEVAKDYFQEIARRTLERLERESNPSKTSQDAAAD